MERKWKLLYYNRVRIYWGYIKVILSGRLFVLGEVEDFSTRAIKLDGMWSTSQEYGMNSCCRNLCKISTAHCNKFYVGVQATVTKFKSQHLFSLGPAKQLKASIEHPRAAV